MEKQQTFGALIANMRRERGMTQAELADKMGVTDKAVSKWERDLSLPDTASLPRLAEIFDVSLDELMSVQLSTAEEPVNEKEEGKKERKKLLRLILKGVALAEGVALFVLSILGQIDVPSGFGMVGIGILCLAILHFVEEDSDKKE